MRPLKDNQTLAVTTVYRPPSGLGDLALKRLRPLDAFSRCEGPLSPKDIAELLGRSDVRQMLGPMVKNGDRLRGIGEIVRQSVKG